MFLHSEPMQQIEYGLVGLDILFRQLGNEFPHVIEAELILWRYLARKESACNRRERYDSDSFFKAYRKKYSVSQSRSTIE